MTQDRPLVRYHIRPSHPEAHLFGVDLEVREPDPAGQILSLPAWIPGSYMVREFARNIVRIDARCGRQRIALEKIDKHTWRAAACSGALSLRYEVYAWDHSVRGAHLDTGHGFFNGTSVFLRVHGHEDAACLVEIVRPEGRAYRHWRVATAMASAGAGADGFGSYRAQDYDELIDHPVEMGTFSLVTFNARGVAHDIAITGRHDCDMKRLARDLKRMVEAHMSLFGGPPPVERYVFLVSAVGEGYGGLEHRASTALMCSRYDLPRARVARQDERYFTFLGLASHEYFHTWNVKRIKPAAFTPYDLARENYTRLLWAFEGITSYYDDLALARSGLMSRQQYLRCLARTMTAVERGSGRRKQSVSESSFDAWIKYYRQDENAPNAIVSYYAKGSLIALALDLTLRKATRGRRSLDDLMRALWRDFGDGRRGVAETEIEAMAERIAGVPLARFFERALRSTEDMKLAGLLRDFGVRTHLGRAQSTSDRGGTPAARNPATAAQRAVLGARIDSSGAEVKLGQVFDGGAAQAAGLAAGDVLVAINRIRVAAATLETMLARYRPGDVVEVSAFRRDELIERELRLLAPPRDTYVLEPDPHASATQRRMRDAWLGGGKATARPAHRARSLSA
ncbi:MAG: M61 family metallopeptidase [Burkholderiales bacterium]|nr:M61 family metallopeptidase [Burkholderiales bacterium]